MDLYHFDRPVGIGDAPLGGQQPLGPQGPLLPPTQGSPSGERRQRLDSSNGKIGDVEGECACTRY